MRRSSTAMKQKNILATIRQAFMVTVVSTFLITFVSSCARVAPADPVANATSNSQPVNSKLEEAEVRKFIDDHVAAMVRADTATLERLWADDLVLIDHDGSTLTKAQWLDLLSSGTERIEPGPPASKDKMDVRIYGNTAVVIIKATQKAILKGAPHDGTMTISAVVVKSDRGLQLVSVQLSELTPLSEANSGSSR